MLSLGQSVTEVFPSLLDCLLFLNGATASFGGVVIAGVVGDSTVGAPDVEVLSVFFGGVTYDGEVTITGGTWSLPSWGGVPIDSKFDGSVLSPMPSLS